MFHRFYITSLAQTTRRRPKIDFHPFDAYDGNIWSKTMIKRSITPKRPVHPSPAALITCIDREGHPNIISLAEVFNISIKEPVILGIAIAKQRYSHKLISDMGEFVVNLPTAAMVETVDRCGAMSGRDYDKFEELGLTAVPAEKIRPPLIAECPINVECRVVGIYEVGDHDLFLGEAMAEHVAEDALDKEDKVIVDKTDPLCYLHGEYWTCGRKLNLHRFTRDR